ncbi:MAG TPA: ABC transporter permease [Thermomicrobiales bacterium]|jgi:peptide/nickel transport system permease protein|nr:ABC transporter permease [Thermomicrobiales bacterium]
MTISVETIEAKSADNRSPVDTRRKGRLNPVVAYLLRRLGIYLLTLWGAITLSFLFFRLIPGDPISAFVTSMESQGRYGAGDSSEQVVEYYRQQFGLDGTLLEQYLRYMERVVFHFDFGPSLVSYPTPSTDLIMRALPWTLGLVGAATILSWVIGVLLGTLLGWTRSSWISRWSTNLSLGVSHIHAYFIALLFVYAFAYWNPWLPASGAYDARIEPGWSLDFIGSIIKHGTLPVLSIALVGATGWMISTRALVVAILGEDYLTFAAAKGLSRWRILTRYVMRNAWLPQVAALGITLGGVVGGSVLIENLFRYPGLGALLVNALGVRDLNTAQAVVSLLIVFVLTANLIIDLLLPLLDPRVRQHR